MNANKKNESGKRIRVVCISVDRARKEASEKRHGEGRRICAPSWGKCMLGQFLEVGTFQMLQKSCRPNLNLSKEMKLFA